MLFQPRSKALEDLPRLILGRLGYRHPPEPAFQRRVLFDVFPVFLQCGCADHLYLSPPQSRFHQIGCINSPLRRTGTDNGVQFVNKEDYIARSTDLLDDVPNPFLKLAAVFGAGDQACHIHGHQPFSPQLIRHLTHGQPLGKTFDNRRLANARFAHQCGVILLFPAQNLKYHIDLLIPADHRLHGRRFFH